VHFLAIIIIAEEIIQLAFVDTHLFRHKGNCNARGRNPDQYKLFYLNRILYWFGKHPKPKKRIEGSLEDKRHGKTYPN
jgi:hypothetical protein